MKNLIILFLITFLLVSYSNLNAQEDDPLADSKVIRTGEEDDSFKIKICNY